MAGKTVRVDLRLAAAGLLVGTIAGMSGIGGSALLAPILILIFGVNASVAIGTDLIYSVPMKLFAAFVHIKQRTVDMTVVRHLAIGGIPGSLAGLALFALLRSRVPIATMEHFLRHAIGVVILVAAAIAVYVYFARPRALLTATLLPQKTMAVGLVVGFLVAMTSIGSGSITLPFLMLVLPAVSLRTLIGSEIVFAALIVPVAAAGHIAFANVNWPMALSLTIGAVPGAYIGAKLCARIGERALRPVIIAIVAFAGFKLL
jgi:uncharacterized membrane protein YfcA